MTMQPSMKQDENEGRNPFSEPARAPGDGARLSSNPEEGKPAGCACQVPASTLVYAFGELGFDFGTQARRDSLSQRHGLPVDRTEQLLGHLERSPWDAAAVTWTLNLGATPIYAIRPEGPFSHVTYERLRTFLEEQASKTIDRISVPGIVTGTATLMSGQRVAVVAPDLRGMYSWTTEALISAAVGDPLGDAAEHERKRAGVRSFLERVYYELRNLGQSPRDRALNFAATNAFQAAEVFGAAARQGLALESVGVERSPICSPGTDCWDVRIALFEPSDRMGKARMVHRFTIDVSDVVPVTVGPVRSWHEY